MRVDLTAAHRLLLGLGLLLVPACGGSSGGGGGSSGGSSNGFAIIEASNGFGRLLPYQIGVLDASGQPTNQVIEITRFEQLVANAALNNPIKPPTKWPVDAVLPNSQAGNHFLFVRFTQPIDPASVLSRDIGAGIGTLGAGIQVETVNPVSGDIVPIEGRGFVGGGTYGPGVSSSNPTQLAFRTWVAPDGAGGLSAETIGGGTPGLGFPGTESSFSGSLDLVDASTFVFVVDSDNDLSTHETFPTGVQIQMRIGSAVRSTGGRFLSQVGLASSTVGPDTIKPEVLVRGTLQDPVIDPGNNEADVDPQANVFVQFTEPVQILTVGNLDDGTPPALSVAVVLRFGPSTSKVQVPFTVRPVSIFDLSRLELAPTYDFPGTGPAQPGVNCDSAFGTVEVIVNVNQFSDLSANKNAQGPTTRFTTREGPGLVNAPVTPDAVYVGRAGSKQGISVIDLNGFGQGTGDPRFDINDPIVEGHTNFPNNPNVKLNGALLIPPLAQGTCTFNGGSAGVFTLTKDSSLRDILATTPQLESVGDMALGHPLDNTFNNEQPFGCQSGGGNICAQSGFKNVSIISGGPFTVASANIAGIAPLKTDQGVENLVSWAPHPNPPPLRFPPLCLSPLINGVEPTSIDTTFPVAPLTALPPFPARSGPGLANLLVPGAFPQGIPSIHRPPDGTLVTELTSFFEGPSTPQPTVPACSVFMIRQQVGQFLYVVDRAAGEIVIFNSNRFTVLDRIRLPDPTKLAMSPNLDLLAVTNEDADQVSFIDIDPASANFHQVIKTTRVGTGPTGIAWEPGNEDILVCNQAEGTVSIISGFTLDVRKVLRNQLSRPIEVALTPRQTTFGFLRGVYFGYILNQNGIVAIYESGPDGVQGIGFDDVITSLPFRFQRPKTLQADPTNLNSGVWIVHEFPLDVAGQATLGSGGAISNVAITGGTVGPVSLDGSFGSPTLRELTFSVQSSIGEGPTGLSGIPVDIAFDNMRNLSALTNFTTAFSPGTALSWNGKSLVKTGPIAVSAPLFLFAAVPNPGVVDVYDMRSGSLNRRDTNAFRDGIQSIPAPNASVLMDYFRQ